MARSPNSARSSSLACRVPGLPHVLQRPPGVRPRQDRVAVPEPRPLLLIANAPLNLVLVQPYEVLGLDQDIVARSHHKQILAVLAESGAPALLVACADGDRLG